MGKLSYLLTVAIANLDEYENDMVKITAITAPQNGKFYFFKKYYETNSLKDNNAVTSNSSITSFPTISIYPHEVLGVYANEGDTRETAIAWYNKTCNAHEE